MVRVVGSRTIDGASSLRCMLVGLNPAQETVCRRALVPVEVVKTRDAREACTSMSTVLPLVVIVDEELLEAERTILSEMATACGAEIVHIEAEPVVASFTTRVLEGLRVAERRRLGMRG